MRCVCLQIAANHWLMHEGFVMWRCTGVIYVCTGTSYAFGVYSEDLRTKLGFRQVRWNPSGSRISSPLIRLTCTSSAAELAVIASVGGTGLYLSVVSGVLVNQLGPRAVVAMVSGFAFVERWVVEGAPLTGAFSLRINRVHALAGWASPTCTP
jgi:hypothetical protein